MASNENSDIDAAGTHNGNNTPSSSSSDYGEVIMTPASTQNGDVTTAGNTTSSSASNENGETGAAGTHNGTITPSSSSSDYGGGITPASTQGGDATTTAGNTTFSAAPAENAGSAQSWLTQAFLNPATQGRRSYAEVARNPPRVRAINAIVNQRGRTVRWTPEEILRRQQAEARERNRQLAEERAWEAVRTNERLALAQYNLVRHREICKSDAERVREEEDKEDREEMEGVKVKLSFEGKMAKKLGWDGCR